jgi:hypothetical protein
MSFNAIESLINFLNNLISSVPGNEKIIVDLFLYTFFILFFIIFVWKFHKFISARDFFELNLRQYNRTEHPKLEKIIAMILYILEYLIILPFLVVCWFVVFALFLIALSMLSNTSNIVDTPLLLLLGAAIVAVNRITAYIDQEMSKEFAKILPLNLLAIFVISSKTFNLNALIDKIAEIPSFFNNILVLLGFVIGIELILRGFYSLNQLVKSEED